MPGIAKIIILVFLVCIIFSLARPALASNLEVRYPSIPGIGSLEEGQQLKDKGEQMAFYVRYIFRLVFYIVLGVCVAVLITAGVLYITAAQRPAVIVAAKELVQRALLGLGILVGSYLILYAINPQLLVLKLAIEEPEAVKPLPGAEAGQAGEVHAYFVNPAAVARETIDNVTEELHYHGLNDPRNDYDEHYRLLTGKASPQVFRAKEGILARLFSKIARPVSASNPPVALMVYRSEIPLRQTEKIVEDMVELVRGARDADNKVVPGKEGLEDLLRECKCGESKSHTKWGWQFKSEGKIVKTYTASFEGACMGGLSEAEEGLFWKEYVDKTPKNICFTKCSDCGTAKKEGELSCDLREIRVEQTPIEVGAQGKKDIEVVFIKTSEKTSKTELKWEVLDWKPLGWVPDVGWKPYGTFTSQDGSMQASLAPSNINKDKSIQYKRYRLQQLLAELEGQKDKYFPEQVGPVDKTLVNNAADYLVFNVKAGMFQSDFAVQKREWEEQGLTVKIEPFKQTTAGLNEPIIPSAAQKNPWERFLSFFVKPVAAQFAPPAAWFEGTNYYLVVEAPPGVLDDVTKHNQFVYREAGRASLFSVLTDLSLEKIQAMFQRCLTAAFGAADYHIDNKDISSVIQRALEGGAADEFIKNLKENIPQLMAAIGKTYSDGLKGRVDAGCAVECGFAGGNEAALKNFIEQHKDCVDPCIKENLSPDFVSRTITGFLTADIDTWFGKEVKATLDGKIRGLLGEDINRQLNKDMYKFYDAVLRGLLSQSLEKKIPGLKDVLATKLTEVKFLDVVLGRLKEVDELLTCKISGCCRPVASEQECVEELFNQLPTSDGGSIKQCGTAKTGFRNVASKHQCKKEVFQEKNNTKQCCEQGLRQKVESFAEDKISALAKKYTSEKASKLIEGFKERHPDFFPENLAAENCSLFNGSFFEHNQDFINQFYYGCDPAFTKTDTGKCNKMTPDFINRLGTDKIMVFTKLGVGKDGCLIAKSSNIIPQDREGICRGAGYCWGKNYEHEELGVFEGRSGSEQCRECNWIGQGFTRGEGMAGAKANLRKIGRDFLGGLVNFGEQFISALVETTLHMAIEYAKVWIEDTITAPLMPYFKQVMKFQDTLHKFLNASVKDILPGPIRETLEKNLDTVIADLCKTYKEQKDRGETTIQFAEYDWLRWDTDTGPGENYQSVSFQVSPEIDEKFGGKVCKFSKHLHTTLLDEIAADSELGDRAAEMLNNTIKEELAYACKVELAGKRYTCTQLLEMNLAEMVFAFTPLKNIKDLINGTPKQVICGELAVTWEKEGGGEEHLTPKQVCDSIQVTGPVELLFSGSGLDEKFYKTLLSPINLSLPFINRKSARYLGLSDAEKKFYQGYCPFVWAACQKIEVSAAVSEATIGGAIKQILEKGCSWLGHTLEHGLTMKDEQGRDVQLPVPPPPLCPQNSNCLEVPVCEGKCLSSNPLDAGLKDLQDDQDPQCLSVFKKTCSGCNTLLNNSMAFTAFYWAIKSDFVIPNDVYQPPLTVELTEKQQQEGEAYQWLYIYFPGLVQDIQAVALKRGFTVQEWADLKQEVDSGQKAISDYDFANVSTKVWLQAFIRGLTGATVKEILTDIPFGVVKPQEPGEATLLRPAGKGESKNFLVKTPFGLLVNDVCGKVVYDFENDENLKYWSLPEVARREAANLGTAPQYSMEGLESSTLAKNLDIILHSPVAGEQKIPYLFCRVLQYSPAQAVGLSEKLMTYVRPKQAQIMFQLIDDKLHYDSDPSKNEMPRQLKELIDYLNNQSPLGALLDLADGINGEQGGQLKRLFSVRVDYRPDRDLQHILADPGDAVKDAFKNNGLGLLLVDLYFYPVSFRIGDADTAMGLYRDAGHQDELGFYVIKTITDEKVFLVVYYDPAKLKSGINSFVKFLSTPVQGLLFERLAGREALFTPIIDTICREPLEVPNTGPPPTVISDWCSLRLDIQRNDLLRVIEKFLQQKPADLLTRYLNYPLIDCAGDRCEWKKSVSIMDWLSRKYPFLGQKYIDTLGRKLGWDKWLYNQEQGVGDAQKLIDNSVSNMKTAFQDQLNNALIEKPAQAVAYVTEYLANLIGGETGKKLAGDITGVCDTVYTESACKQEGKIYRASQGAEPAQCCSLGKNVVCEPRCRPKPNNQDCDKALKEEEVQTPTPDQLGLHCCLGLFGAGDYEGQCKVCRLIPAVDDAEDRGCREGEVKEGGIGKLQVCCKPKERVFTEESGKVVEDKCCTTVIDCVADQFDEHLRVLAETMAQGSLPLDSLTGER